MASISRLSLHSFIHSFMQRVETLCGTYRAILDRNNEFIGAGEIIIVLESFGKQLFFLIFFCTKLRKSSKTSQQIAVQWLGRNFHTPPTFREQHNNIESKIHNNLCKRLGTIHIIYGVVVYKNIDQHRKVTIELYLIKYNDK